MKRACIAWLICLLICFSAAAEPTQPDSEGPMLTFQDVFTLSCPPGTKISQPSSDLSGEYALLRIPGSRASVPIYVFVVDRREETGSMSLASLTESGFEQTIARFLNNQGHGSTATIVEALHDQPSGISTLLISWNTPAQVSYTLYTDIRGWTIMFETDAVSLSGTRRVEYLEALRQLPGRMTLKHSAVQPACVDLLGLVTLDCPEDWLFTDTLNEAYSDLDNNLYFLGTFFHEGFSYSLEGSPATRRSKRQDFAEMTAEQKQSYILDAAREGNSAGVNFTYQYTFDGNDAGIPFLIFYAEPRNGDHRWYEARTVYRGAAFSLIGQRIYDGLTRNADEVEGLEELLSTARLVPAPQ